MDEEKQNIRQRTVSVGSRSLSPIPERRGRGRDRFKTRVKHPRSKSVEKATQKTAIVYSGRFQPPHKGHITI